MSPVLSEVSLPVPAAGKNVIEVPHPKRHPAGLFEKSSSMSTAMYSDDVGQALARELPGRPVDGQSVYAKFAAAQNSSTLNANVE